MQNRCSSEWADGGVQRTSRLGCDAEIIRWTAEKKKIWRWWLSQPLPSASCVRYPTKLVPEAPETSAGRIESWTRNGLHASTKRFLRTLATCPPNSINRRFRKGFRSRPNAGETHGFLAIKILQDSCICVLVSTAEARKQLLSCAGHNICTAKGTRTVPRSYHYNRNGRGIKFQHSLEQTIDWLIDYTLHRSYFTQRLTRRK
jgi:hypothetical protein